MALKAMGVRAPARQALDCVGWGTDTGGVGCRNGSLNARFRDPQSRIGDATEIPMYIGGGALLVIIILLIVFT